MNDIDKIFQNKLKGFEKTPPPKVWEKLHASLEHNNNRRKGFIWYSIAAGIALMISVSVLIINVKPDEKAKAQKSLPIEKIKSKPLVAENITNNRLNKIEVLPAKKEILQNKISSVAEKKKITSSRKNDHIEVEENFVFKEGAPLPAFEEEIIEEEMEKELAVIQEQELDYSLPTNTISVVVKRGTPSSMPESTEENGRNFLKNSKLGRVYSEVLNLKNGEKVNLNEFSNLLAFDKKEKQTQHK